MKPKIKYNYLKINIQRFNFYMQKLLECYKLRESYLMKILSTVVDAHL